MPFLRRSGIISFLLSCVLGMIFFSNKKTKPNLPPAQPPTSCLNACGDCMGPSAGGLNLRGYTVEGIVAIDPSSLGCVSDIASDIASELHQMAMGKREETGLGVTIEESRHWSEEFMVASLKGEVSRSDHGDLVLDPFFDWKTIGSVDFCTKIIKVPPEAYQAIQRAIAVADDQDHSTHVDTSKAAIKQPNENIERSSLAYLLSFYITVAISVPLLLVSLVLVPLEMLFRCPVFIISAILTYRLLRRYVTFASIHNVMRRQRSQAVKTTAELIGNIIIGNSLNNGGIVQTPRPCQYMAEEAEAQPVVGAVLEDRTCHLTPATNDFLHSLKAQRALRPSVFQSVLGASILALGPVKDTFILAELIKSHLHAYTHIIAPWFDAFTGGFYVIIVSTGAFGIYAREVRALVSQWAFKVPYLTGRITRYLPGIAKQIFSNNIVGIPIRYALARQGSRVSQWDSFKQLYLTTSRFAPLILQKEKLFFEPAPERDQVELDESQLRIVETRAFAGFTSFGEQVAGLEHA